MNVPVSGSRRLPGERTTSCTIGGAGAGPAWIVERRCKRFLRHSAHTPSGPGVPPQAHLRCNKPIRTGVKVGLEWLWVDTTVVLFWSLMDHVARFIAVRHGNTR